VNSAPSLFTKTKMKYYHARINTSHSVEFLIAADDIDMARTMAVQLKHGRSVETDVIQLQEYSDDSINLAESEESDWNNAKTKKGVT
jgi:hypothetical protein